MSVFDDVILDASGLQGEPTQYYMWSLNVIDDPTREDMLAVPDEITEILTYLQELLPGVSSWGTEVDTNGTMQLFASQLSLSEYDDLIRPLEVALLPAMGSTSNFEVSPRPPAYSNDHIAGFYHLLLDFPESDPRRRVAVAAGVEVPEGFDLAGVDPCVRQHLHSQVPVLLCPRPAHPVFLARVGLDVLGRPRGAEFSFRDRNIDQLVASVSDAIMSAA
ncbi:hypothetical protein [Tessaracoccus sp.]